jgi:5'-methylthioadenosine phosphorylase
MPKVAIIGGTGVYESGFLAGVTDITVQTPYGAAVAQQGVYTGPSGRQLEVAFLARHGAGHSVPPHRINYRANIWGLAELGVERIVGTAAVGGLRDDLPPGHCVLVDSFLDFTRGRAGTFFEGDFGPAGGPTGVAHTDMTEPYCGEMRGLLRRAAESSGIEVASGGCYVCTDGPRFESPAEIRMFRMLGADVVGMTNVPEVVLARELGMCYALVAMVTNYAAGMTANRLTHAEVVETMANNVRKIRTMAWKALDLLPEARGCACGSVERPIGQSGKRGE